MTAPDRVHEPVDGEREVQSDECHQHDAAGKEHAGSRASEAQRPDRDQDHEEHHERRDEPDAAHDEDRDQRLGEGRGAVSEGRGKLFIEMSTAGPGILRVLAADIAAARGRLVDAPIVGAPPAMRAGQVAILIGGDDLDVGLATPVLSVLGTVRHVGPLGSGARLKLVANSMLADVVLAAAELQVAGERAGLQPDDVSWVLERMAPLLAARRNGIVENHHEPTLFALRDLRKDLDLAVGLFGRSKVDAPLTVEARHLVAAAASKYGDLDITAVARPYRELAPDPES